MKPKKKSTVSCNGLVHVVVTMDESVHYLVNTLR